MSKPKRRQAEKPQTESKPYSEVEHDLMVPGLWPLTLEQALRIAASAPPVPQPEPVPPKKPKASR